jgi:exodeoxyribonuclease VII large subunit
LAEIAHIKLSDLTRSVEDVIKQSFSSTYWIIAEISSHKFYPNQDRHYFDFVEKEEGKNDPIAKVAGRSWYQGSQTLKLFEKETGQTFTSGLQVLVNVKVEFHQAFGFALTLLDIDQAFTLGNLEKQRRETLARLVAENPDAIQKVGEEYRTRNKSISFKPVIQNIAVVGSPNSEGYTDFTHTLSSNQFKYKISVDIYQSSVQGAGVETELVNRLIEIHKSGKPYDTVVIIRGGGAKTDFLVFDTYQLARAVARFPIPIITGIGHHKDVSIVDLMTHTTTKTPTKAAEFIISHNHNFEDSIILLQKNVAIKAQQMLANASQKINNTNLVIVNKTRTFLAHYKEGLANFNQIVVNKTKTILYNRQTNLVNLLNNILSRPKIITANRNNDLVNIINNLKVFTTSYFKNQRGYVGHYAEVVKLMHPENILKKGFAIVKRKGTIIKSPESILAGEDLTITMETFDINTKVISKTPTNG